MIVAEVQAMNYVSIKEETQLVAYPPPHTLVGHYKRHTWTLTFLRSRRRGVVIFFFQAEDGIRDYKVTGVQTCALPISSTALGWTPLDPGARLKAPFGRGLGATQTSERISEAVHGYCYAASVRFAPGASRTVLLDGSRHQRAGKRSFISRSGRYP